MKSASKGRSQVSGFGLRLRSGGMALLLFFIFTGTTASRAATTDLFSIVPDGDPTYQKLAQLAKAGLLKKDAAASPLTRYDVARSILKAQQKYDELVMAQADTEIPPPPADTDSTATSSSTSTVPTPAPVTGASQTDMEIAPPSDNGAAPAASDQTAAPVVAGPPTPEADDNASLAKAAENLHSLQEAYQSELTKVKDRLKALHDEVDQADSDQYDLRKRIKGITQFPSISIHGLGRAFALSEQQWGSVPPYIIVPGTRSTRGYMDLDMDGTVGKEISWGSVLGIQSQLIANDSPILTVRRVSMNFNPSWMSATIGDFYEAYTPLVLWNRNTLDLAWAPEMWSRMDDQAKYEAYLNNEPYLPLRGLKMGTDMMWPDSAVVEEFKTSVFANMIRNGFADSGSPNWYFGPNQYTDWAFGANASLKSPKWYLGGTTVKLNLDTYGLWLVEPLDSTQPGSPYGLFTTSTWAHQYLIGSVRPDIKVGFGGDFYAGGAIEYAFSHYNDDELDPRKAMNDFALLGGPYLQWGDSKLTFNYLNVGPYYYSPMAQTRQDAVTDFSNPSALSFMQSPDLFSPTLRSQFFLSNITRPGGIYSFYDRTQDNTFPYGLGTPNRQGGGIELDVKTLKDKALKIKGSAYFVQEISGNLVVNGAGKAYVPVDSPALTTIVPIRKFTYVNVGPSFDLGPVIGWDRALEIGTNARYEQTTSELGTLTSAWVVGGLRVGVLPFWEISGAFSEQDVNGTDAGYGGTLWARYSYLYDNSDLGQYSAFTVKGSIQSLRFSSTVKVNRNSNIYLDWDWTTGNLLPVNPNQGTFNNQFMELTYEVKF